MIYKEYRTLIAMTILPFYIAGIPTPESYPESPNPNYFYDAFPTADYVNGKDETENNLINGNEKDKEVNPENVHGETAQPIRQQNGIKIFFILPKNQLYTYKIL